MLTKTLESNWSEEVNKAVFEFLLHTKVLLQYGCSSVTALACELGNVQKVVSVEAEKAKSDQIYQSIISKEKLHMVHANVGDLSQPTYDAKFKSYHTYMVYPWALVDKYMLTPDTILIDGQFKVASFLYSLICAEEGTDILFNDFYKNPQFEIVRNFCAVESKYGDMAHFIVKKDYLMSDITAHIAKYSVIAD